MLFSNYSAKMNGMTGSPEWRTVSQKSCWKMLLSSSSPQSKGSTALRLVVLRKIFSIPEPFVNMDGNAWSDLEPITSWRNLVVQQHTPGPYFVNSLGFLFLCLFDICLSNKRLLLSGSPNLSKKTRGALIPNTVECLCTEITCIMKDRLCPGRIPMFHMYGERLYNEGIQASPTGHLLL